MKKYLLSWALILASAFRLFSAEYHLNLVPEPWKVAPKGYFISEVRDARADKSIGNVMVNGKIVPATLKSPITEELLSYLKGSVSFDTTTIPVIIEIQKFHLAVKGTAVKHQASLDFAIRFVREINGEIYELFQLSGKPQINAQGNIPEVGEKNISAAMQQSFTNFDSWIKDNMNILPMVTSVEVQFLPETKLKPDVGDTLIWDNTYKLVWTDFQGQPPASDFAAESNCMFNYKAHTEIVSGKMILYVNFNACFIKGSSWVKEGSLQDSLLLHEQYHFNICEAHARKFRSRLKELKLSPMKIEQQIKVVFDEEWKAYVQAQDLYDEQTQHGIVREMQEQWMRDVDYWLTEQ